MNADHEIIAGLIDKQIEYEEFTREKASEEIENAGYPNRHMEAKPPRPKEDFSPARLLLSHLGYLSLENLMVSLMKVETSSADCCHDQKAAVCILSAISPAEVC